MNVPEPSGRSERRLDCSGVARLDEKSSMQGRSLRIIMLFRALLCAFSDRPDRFRSGIGRSLRLVESPLTLLKLNTQRVTRPRRMGMLATIIATLFSMWLIQ